jgi:hypothetical protein
MSTLVYEPTDEQLTSDLARLRHLLINLPSDLPDAESVYPSTGVAPNPAMVEKTGNISIAVSHTFETAFGSRANGPPAIKERGSKVVAVVEVLKKHLDEDQSKNRVVLATWVPSLTEAAELIFKEREIDVSSYISFDEGDGA